MVVNDGKIEKMFIEPDVPGDPFEVSDADTMLKYLRPNQKTVGPVLMLARHGCPYLREGQADARGAAASPSTPCTWAMS